MGGQRLAQALVLEGSFVSGHLLTLCFIKIIRDRPCLRSRPEPQQGPEGVCQLLLPSSLSGIVCKFRRHPFFLSKKTLVNKESSLSGSTVSVRFHLRGLRGRQPPTCPGDVCAGVPAYGWAGMGTSSLGALLGKHPTNPQSKPGSSPFLILGLSDLRNIPLINGKVLEMRRPASNHRDPQPRTSWD